MGAALRCHAQPPPVRYCDAAQRRGRAITQFPPACPETINGSASASLSGPEADLTAASSPGTTHFIRSRVGVGWGGGRVCSRSIQNPRRCGVCGGTCGCCDWGAGDRRSVGGVDAHPGVSAARTWRRLLNPSVLVGLQKVARHLHAVWSRLSTEAHCGSRGDVTWFT